MLVTIDVEDRSTEHDKISRNHVVHLYALLEPDLVGDAGIPGPVMAYFILSIFYTQLHCCSYFEA